MGAAAFMLLTGSDRSAGAWPLGADSYAVLKKAVSEKRGCRQRTIRQFVNEWNTAKSE